LQANADVLRAIAKKDLETNGTKLILLSRSGKLFTDTELDNIATFIYERSRAFDIVRAVNMVMTDIFISFESVLKPSVLLDEIYVSAADAIANLIDYATWSTQQLVDDDVLVEVKKVGDFKDIDLSTFLLIAFQNGVQVGQGTVNFIDSLPRFARLKITNSETHEEKDLVLSQSSITIV
jgi:hypothetical protein